MSEAANPTFAGLIAEANRLFGTGTTATPEEATELRAIVDRLTADGRGATLDGSDPANSAIMTTVL